MNCVEIEPIIEEDEGIVIWVLVGILMINFF